MRISKSEPWDNRSIILWSLNKGTPNPIPNSLVKPGNAADLQRVHRLEACATREKEDAAGAQVENLYHH